MIKLTFTGDIMSSSKQDRAAYKKGIYDYSDVFANVSKQLMQSDFVCGNLETTISGESMGYTSASASFNTPEPFLYSIKKAGIDFVSIANNHILDRGIIGLDKTIDALNRNKLGFTGAYKSIEESELIYIKEISNTKIAFLSFTYGLNSEYHGITLPEDIIYKVDLLKEQAKFNGLPINNTSIRKKITKFIPVYIKRCIINILEIINKKPNSVGVIDNVNDEEILNINNQVFIAKLKRKIKTAKNNADIVVLSLHCGGQYNNTIGNYTKHIYDILRNEPIDIVIGNHPHCVLPHFIHNNKLFTYSLGNFSFSPFDGWYVDGVYADYSILLNAYIDAKRKSVHKYTYSIIKNRYKGNLSQPYFLYDLIEKEKNKKVKDKLINDNIKVIRRFTGKENILLQKEYNL